MSVIVIAVASDSGVPIFSRKRGNNDNVSSYILKTLFYNILFHLKCKHLHIKYFNNDTDSIFNNCFITWNKYVYKMPQFITAKY